MTETLADYAPFHAAAHALVEREPAFAPVYQAHGFPRWPLRPAGFSSLVRIIIEQQISFYAAQALWQRAHGVLGDITPQAVAAADEETMKAAGFSHQKAGYAKRLAAATLAGELDATALAGADTQTITATLTRYKGLGPWSVDIFRLYCARHTDVWAVGDLAVRAGYSRIMGLAKRPDPAACRDAGAAFAAHASAATILCWQAVIHRFAAPEARQSRDAPAIGTIHGS